MQTKQILSNIYYYDIGRIGIFGKQFQEFNEVLHSDEFSADELAPMTADQTERIDGIIWINNDRLSNHEIQNTFLRCGNEANIEIYYTTAVIFIHIPTFEKRKKFLFFAVD
ncbi:unnamed protein product [Didymodactylos carnosus]|uniref:Uncharacterized protein n=1 Tax=Didymodactylos carnosus TaxID=1234261 RepID=A0A8S2SMY9_9BILA|nr:unnamed protein product [Didymodactylos carnosus]CAF4239134.1 unnamed protein product [Didymodactylos carnosus]